MIYDLFIQNQISHTSHTLEWLPISDTDQANPKFDFNYFLLGTHVDSSEKNSVYSSVGKNQDYL